MITPLGEGTERNLEAVLRGESRLQRYTSVHGETVPEPFVGSLFEILPERAGYTPFEALCIAAAEGAIREAPTDVTAEDCVFVLSTTKGNIWSSPAESAHKIAEFFGNHTTPVVVSTACTSGVSAQLTAYRLLSAGIYRTAVLIGCDVQSRFVVSGFQSFKALSPEVCRPFDAERQGLNAGEAAAAMVLQTDGLEGSRSARSLSSSKSSRSSNLRVASDDRQSRVSSLRSWTLLGGSIHNDANHISGPSRTAEGSLRCLQDALALLPADSLACVSVHGTGTAYNDEMESIALHRAGLEETPVSALKGFYGHTMGAAGLMETILTIHALNRGLVLPTRGFAHKGTTYPVNVSPEVRTTEKRAFVKLLSGFGGVNAAVAWTGGSPATTEDTEKRETQVINEVRVDGTHGPNGPNGTNGTNGAKDDIVGRYRVLGVAYPKFFKMDTLCRLGFVAVEELLRGHEEQIDAEHTALILANRSASLKNDKDYQATIADPENYFPSPALFVYTLPNIVTGELAIRHGLYGETAFYVLEKEDDLLPIVEATLREPQIRSAIVGWVECSAADNYEAHVKLVEGVKE